MRVLAFARISSNLAEPRTLTRTVVFPPAPAGSERTDTAPLLR